MNWTKPILILAITASACHSPTANNSDLFAGAKQMGKVSGELEEASGLAASVQNPNYLWTLNDSGNPAEVFLIDSVAEVVMTVKLKGLKNRDWEDIAMGPGPDEETPYIYVGEVGDNEARYDLKYIYRFPEPHFAGNKTLTIEEFDTLIVKLPDGKRDMEAIAVDPQNGDLYLISKREENVNVYWQSYAYLPMDTLVPKAIASLPYRNVVAADFSKDGSEFLLKTYDEVLYWKRSGDMTVQQMLLQTPEKLNYEREPQGEAIAWALNGSGFYTLSESVKSANAILYFYKRN